MSEFKTFLGLLRDLINHSELKLIASRDYENDVEKHLEPLTRIYQTLEVENLDPWYPLEVIELCRWDPPVERYASHNIRAFCCGILLYSYCKRSNMFFRLDPGKSA